MAAHAIRVPRRRRWPSRILGVLATAALLGSGVAIAMMVMPEQEAAAPPTTPAATPAPAPAKKKGGLTKAQKAARHDAAVVLREQGYEPVRLADWKPGHDLRVLVGKSDTGALRAFFFYDGEFVGNDDPSSSQKLRVAKAGPSGVTLAYGLQTGETTKVKFTWVDGQLTPAGDVPPVTQR
jgi:hypothetical protein